MKVVFHQAVGVDCKTRFLARLGQGLQEVLTIDIIQKNGFLAIPAGNSHSFPPKKARKEWTSHKIVVTSGVGRVKNAAL